MCITLSSHGEVFLLRLMFMDIYASMHTRCIHCYMYIHIAHKIQSTHYNWRAGASQPSCTTGTIFLYTSVKIIQLNEYGCRDAPCEKSWKQGNPLSNTIKDTSTIMRNPLSELCREGYASILDSIAKGISLFPRFFAWCIPTSIFIQLNDFYTCSTYFSWFAYKRS